MDRGAIDLRRYDVGLVLLSMLVLGPFAALVLVAAVRGDVGGAGRILAWVLGTLCGGAALGSLFQLVRMRRRRRLLIDHEGIRLDTGGRRPRFRIGWTELAEVGLLVDDSARRRRSRRRSALPHKARPISAALEMVPVDAEAVRRHPELRGAWRLGRQRSWRIVLTTASGDPPPVGDLVRRWRPALWTGERRGSLWRA